MYVDYLEEPIQIHEEEFRRETRTKNSQEYDYERLSPEGTFETFTGDEDNSEQQGAQILGKLHNSKGKRTPSRVSFLYT